MDTFHPPNPLWEVQRILRPQKRPEQRLQLSEPRSRKLGMRESFRAIEHAPATSLCKNFYPGFRDLPECPDLQLTLALLLIPRHQHSFRVQCSPFPQGQGSYLPAASRLLHRHLFQNTEISQLLVKLNQMTNPQEVRTESS